MPINDFISKKALTKIILSLSLASFLVFAFSATSFAVGIVQWETDGEEICTDPGYQYIDSWSQGIASDGAGGAIITWDDRRSGNAIYAQKIDQDGVPQWTTDGVAICTATGYRYDPTITNDGNGGAIITWEDRRSGYAIYAQKVDSSGNVQWTTDGIAIRSNTPGDSVYDPKITSDGNGGAIVTWEDRRSGYAIYAQKVDRSGNVQWTTDGVVLRSGSVSSYVWDPQITPDGNGGAIVTWEDRRSGYYNVYAQKIAASGITGWTLNGIAVCAYSTSQYDPQIVSDGNGGAIITWYDRRSGYSNHNIYAQKIDSSGTKQWATNGVGICTIASDQYYPKIASDGAGGAIITWVDFRYNPHSYVYYWYSDTNADIYAQRVNSNGDTAWTADGIPICTEENIQRYPQIVSDGNGGAVITWPDLRDGNFYAYCYYGYANSDIYAQKVDGNGNIQWTLNGLAVCAEEETQKYPLLTSDGAGGAIVTWQDERNGSYSPYYGYAYNNSDVYAQRVANIVPLPPTIDPVKSPTFSSGQTITGIMAALTADILVNGVSGEVILDTDAGTWSYTAQFSGAGTFTFNFVTVTTYDEESDPATVAIAASPGTLGVPAPLGEEDLGEASVSIPVGLVSDQHVYVNVEGEGRDILPATLPAGTALVSYLVDITITNEAGADVTSLDNPITITIPISSQAGEWQGYHPYWFYTQHNTWVRIPDEDIVEKTSTHITFQTTHLTVFGILQVPDAQKPTIGNLQFDGLTVQDGDFANPRPTISAALTDAGGAGIDSTSIVMKIDGTPVTHSYTPVDADQGTVSYQPPTTNLTAGSHTLTIDVSDTVSNAADTLSINFEVETGLKAKSALSFPSPVDPTQESVKISYNLSQDATITVEIYDVNHELIWRTVAGGTTGYNEVLWNGVSLAGNLVPNDIYYFYVISSGQVLAKGKIAVLK